MDLERYQLYLCSREWDLKRESVIARSGGLCERCRHNEGTAVHHKTYARIYNERLTDLIHLCNDCHDFVHGRGHDDPVEVEVEFEFSNEVLHQVINDQAKKILWLRNQVEYYKSILEDISKPVLNIKIESRTRDK
jgi:hypothetical protein